MRRRQKGKPYSEIVAEQQAIGHERHLRVTAMGDYQVVLFIDPDQPYSCIRCGCMISARFAELHRSRCQ